MGLWDLVPGQQPLKKRLSELADSGQVSHAYILEGMPPSARLLLARGFAQRLLCERGTGCGECRTCRMVASDSHLDVIQVTHDKPNVISVEDVRRKLVDDIEIRPYQSRHKIYLVDEADKMNPEAQNALLKTLEEPPSYAMILLLAENRDVFLPTILSRAVLLRMQPSAAEENAISGEEREKVVSLLRHLWEADSEEISGSVKAWKEDGLEAGAILSFLRDWFRDILLWKTLSSDRGLKMKGEKAAIEEAASRTTYRQVQESLQAIDRAEKRLFLNVNETLVLDALFMDMKPVNIVKPMTADEMNELLIPGEEERQFYGV